MDHATCVATNDQDRLDEEAAQIEAMEARYDDWNTLENDRNERLVREAGFAEF